MLRVVSGLVTRRTNSVVSCSKAYGSSVSRGIDRKNTPLSEGEVCHGFEVFQKFEIKEREWTCYRMKHQRTNAEFFHVENSDLENTFGVVFKTPADSSGVPHILEHTTLCGSQKYPVRDPFFNMLKRSINTYMNAWTGNGWTAYPFSSQNKKDYQNLLKVYLDAVFFPNLNRYDFLQEGHRLELTDPNALLLLIDINSPLCIKGVVYNEMKGASASPDRQIIVKLQSEMFPPDITYHHDSGGDPAEIPYLTYEKLKEFHQTNYHPSNTRFYSYGDLPVQETLAYLNDDVLSKFEASKASNDIGRVERFSSIKTVESTTAPYPGVPIEIGNTALISYLTSDVMDIDDSFTLEILSSLMLKGSSSPFYKARMERNGIGKDFSVGTGFSDATRESTFGFGIQGVKEDEIPEVYKMIDSTLDSITNEGFSKERIDSVLHAMEISKKSIPSNFGLNVFGGLVSGWIHGVDIQKFMNVDDLINSFRSNMEENPKFLQEQVSRYFLENKHAVKLICRPDSEYTAKKEKEEVALIEKLSSGLKEEDRRRILKEQQELEQYQFKEQDAEVLPKMVLDDVSREGEKTIVESEDVRGYPTQWNAQPTNELSYVRGLATVNNIPQSLVKYMPLFTTIFGKMGTDQYSYSELSQRIQNYTGGLSASWHVHTNYSNNEQPEWAIRFGSFALERNITPMFDIIRDVYTLEPKGIDQLKSLVLNKTGGMEDSLMSSGHSFAMSYAARNLSSIRKASEELSGVTYLKFLQSIQDDDYDVILQKMHELNEFLQKSAPLRFSVTSEQKLFEGLRNGLESFIDVLPAQRNHSEADTECPEKEGNEKVFIPLQSAVNYCALSLPGVKYTHEDYPKLKVLSTLLSYNFLHPVIREKGGAYGAGLSLSDTLSFYSYRDPNVEQTLEAFCGAPVWLKDSNSFTDTDIEEAKISVFGSLDTPVVPSRKGQTLFSQGITDEMRQKVRDGVFATTRDDLVCMADKYFSDMRNAPVAVIGNPEQIPKGWDVYSLSQ